MMGVIHVIHRSSSNRSWSLSLLIDPVLLVFNGRCNHPRVLALLNRGLEEHWSENHIHHSAEVLYEQRMRYYCVGDLTFRIIRERD